jgi:hypothetical protein
MDAIFQEAAGLRFLGLQKKWLTDLRFTNL